MILAAGAGTRFGPTPKQLAALGGRPLLEWAVRAQCAVPALERVVVVLGSRAVDVRAAVAFGRAETVICDDWESGQAASLRRGLRELPDSDRVVITLGDAPLVTPEVIELFVEAEPRTRALYDGRPGHPVVLGPKRSRRSRRCTATAAPAVCSTAARWWRSDTYAPGATSTPLMT